MEPYYKCTVLLHVLASDDPSPLRHGAVSSEMKLWGGGRLGDYIICEYVPQALVLLSGD